VSLAGDGWERSRLVGEGKSGLFWGASRVGRVCLFWCRAVGLGGGLGFIAFF
jgi:hypothetical protein